MKRQLYSLELLLNALHSDSEEVAAWAAYNFFLFYFPQVEKHLDFFLESPYSGVREAGISFVAEQSLEEYLPRLLTIFSCHSGATKRLAAVALSKFPNDLSTIQLTRWFNELVQSNESNKTDFYYCSLAFIRLDPSQNISLLSRKMLEFIHDPIKGFVLFEIAIGQSSDKSCYAQLMKGYFLMREAFSLLDTPVSLIESLPNKDLVRWVQQLDQQVDFNEIYTEMALLLGTQVNLLERNIWRKIKKHAREISLLRSKKTTNKIYFDFIDILFEWSRLHHKNNKLTLSQQRLIWIIEAFYEHKALFVDGVPKIIEQERALLLAIPILFHLQETFNFWIDNVEDSTEQLATYYHSPLLTHDNREVILNLFFPTAPHWTDSELRIKNHEIKKITDNIHEVIWKLYNGEYLGENISWPSLIPNPSISVHLATCLLQIYKANFSFFIEQEDRLSIDYALQLFQIRHDYKINKLLTEHFEILHRYHLDVLYRVLSYCPSAELVRLLTLKFKPGETETAELIVLASKFLELPVESEIMVEVQKKYQDIQTRFRLECAHCFCSYRYHFGKIYVDETVISQNKTLTNNNIWTASIAECKECGKEISFCLSEEQLEILTNEVWLYKTLEMPKNPNLVLAAKNFTLLPFPSFLGKTYKPQNFERFVAEQAKQQPDNHDTLTALRLKLARMYEVMEQWEKIIELMLTVTLDNNFTIAVKNYLGIAYYHLGNFPKARIIFEKNIKNYKNGVNAYEKIHLEQACQYITIMNTKAGDKKRLRIIHGKERK